MVKLIACVGPNGELGFNNDLIYHNKEDMGFFREQTRNNVVIMGYNTFVSLNNKPLPNRVNIVLTDKELNYPGILTWNLPLKNAIENAKAIFPMLEISIIGGAYVYNEAIEQQLVDEIFLTKMFDSKEADVFINMNNLQNNYNVWSVISVLEENNRDTGLILYLLRRLE